MFIVRAGEKEAKIGAQSRRAVNAGYPAHELGDIIRHLKTPSRQLVERME
jgi:hypothetical protein